MAASSYREENPPPRPACSSLSSSVISIGAPPSYEQALGHRTIECTPYDLQNAGSYPGPPALPGSCGAQGGGGRRRHGCSNENGGVNGGMDLKNGDWCVQMSLPAMHLCMALTCLVFNLLIPGTGTMLSGFGALCCVRQDEWTAGRQCGAFWLCQALGLAQLLLTPVVLMGWVWSVLWGFALVGRSQENYHASARRGTNDHDRRREMSPPPPYILNTEGTTLGDHLPTSHTVTSLVHAPPRQYTLQSPDLAVSSSQPNPTRPQTERTCIPGAYESGRDVTRSDVPQVAGTSQSSRELTGSDVPRVTGTSQSSRELTRSDVPRVTGTSQSSRELTRSDRPPVHMSSARPSVDSMTDVSM